MVNWKVKKSEKEQEVKGMEQMFIQVDEVCELLGVSRSKAYLLMRQLNEELKQKGYMTIAGKVSRKYFMEKFYGMERG